MVAFLRYYNRFYWGIAVIIFVIIPSASFQQNNNARDSSTNKIKARRDTSFGSPNSHHHLKVPVPVLKDSDGDGIPDQFDLEPNTPPGVQVDSHGRAVDTDGDGVPDYKDKEKLTPQKCFPVDSNGVGVCPEPWCCQTDYLLAKTDSGCHINSLPSLVFKKGSAALSAGNKMLLDSVAQLLLVNRGCRIMVRGYTDASYRGVQLSWDKVYSVVQYLVDTKGTLNSHIIFSYANNDDDPDKINLRPTTDIGPYIVPAPHPQFSILKNMDWKKLADEYNNWRERTHH
jgi:flagellar motor protein MotB